MTKTQFKKEAKLLIQSNNKLAYIKLCFDNRIYKITNYKSKNFIEHRGVREIKNFIDNNSMSNIDLVWNYIRAIPPYHVPCNH
jgi:hypothetical protein